jgi:RNA polymerase sigma factor (sigma-70 family)
MSSEIQSVDDLQLVARFQAGDRFAFEELHRRYGQRLIAFLKPRCLGRLDAFEVSQEVWVRVVKALPRFEQGIFSGWLFTIARNLLKDEYRRGQSTAAPLEDGIDPVAPVQQPVNPHMEAMLDCLRNLKRKFVEALQDTLDGLTTNEIAEKFGIGAANVDKWRFRGRSLLKDCVQQKLS